jgi:hypothetical protein
MRPPIFLLQNHRIPHRDPPGAKSLRRTHMSRMFASSGHCQNPARFANTKKNGACDLKIFLWQAMLPELASTIGL